MIKCPRCGDMVVGVSEEDWANLFTANVNFRNAYLKLVEKYENETGKKYDIDAIMTG